MEIKKHISRSLTKSFSKLQEATESQRINEVIDDAINKDELRKVIAYIITLIGFNTEKTSSEEMQIHLAFIRNNFPLIRIAELKLAFEIGVRGDLQDSDGKILDLTHYQSFNSVYISSVINGFKRYKAKKHKDNPTIKPLKELPVVRLNQREQALKAFQEYKVKGKYFDFGNLVYKYLDQEDVLQITNERKKQFWEQAVSNIKQELKENRKKQSVKSVKEAIQGFNESIESNKIKSEAMRLALSDYFKGLIDMDMELKTEL